MIGTIANAAAILMGSITGGLVKHGLKEKYQQLLYVAMGLAAMGLGINAIVSNMGDSIYPVLFIASLAIGGLIGTAMDIEGRFDRLVDRGSRSKRKAAAAEELAVGAIAGDAEAEVGDNDVLDASDASAAVETPVAGAAAVQAPAEGGNPRLAEGLSTAIVLFCFGTLSILGPINSALLGDETYLLTNATLDLVTSLVLASTYGIGIAFAAVFLFAWQGSIWLLAHQLAPLLTPELMREISIVGGFLILASGLSILEVKKIPVINFLPALFIPAIWFAIMNMLPA